MAKVSKRGGFSDRYNIKSENTTIQVNEFDKRTRIQIQNMLSEIYNQVYGHNVYWGNEDIQDFFRYIMGTVYTEPVDVRKKIDDDVIWKMINNTILSDEYDDVLTVMEAIVQYWDRYMRDSRGFEYYNPYDKCYQSTSLFQVVNGFLEREYIGYRFVDGLLTPITDDIEIDAINQAINIKYEPVYTHLSKANKLMADRSSPDYENSIKESISAVEALCEILTGTKGKEATLGKLLKTLDDRGIKIHSGLKSAFITLYGYASDANGIRHAGNIGGPASTFEEAKYMLVSCSAFINYLIGVSAD